MLMGVLNATPDSFSDGGLHNSLEAGLAQAKKLVADGALIVDIGGESTRPGAARVPLEQEQQRVLPLIAALREWLDGSDHGQVQISIDTMNSPTAAAAVAAGASIINDVSGGLADDNMFEVAASSGATLVIGHWRGFSDQMDSLNDYPAGEVAQAVARELAERAKAALGAGVARDRIVLDPGLGFAKNAQQNWQVLAGLDRIYSLGFPVLIGASRKRFIASAIEQQNPGDVGNAQRDAATAALGALLAAKAPSGALWGLRVHEAAGSAAALAIVAAMQTAQDE